MRIPSSLQQIAQATLVNFHKMMASMWQSLAIVVNGNLTFGDGTSIDNINGAWVNVTAPVAPNTDFTMNHNLNRIPVGYWIMQKDRACDVYTGSVAATLNQLTLRATVASAVLRVFIICALLSVFSLSSFAQTTLVSGTVTASDGQTWNNGTFTFTFVPNPRFNGTYYLNGVPFFPTAISGPLSGTGTFSNIVVPSNTAITPSGTFWTINVCPDGSTSQCSTSVNILITGASQNITSSISPPALIVNCGPNVVAYRDSEVSCTKGGTYYNSVSQVGRVCQLAVGNSCTTWANIGGTGGGGPSLQTGGVVNPVQTILNLISGPGISQTADGFGGVTTTNTAPLQAACPPSGGQGTLQAANGTGGCQATSITETGGPPGTQVAIGEETVIGGNNPYHDLRIDGARKMIANAIPSVPGITATVANGSNSVTISTQSCPAQSPTTCFLGTDGVTIVGAGPNHAMVTPAAPTLTQVNNGVVTGVSSETVTAPAGVITYNAQIFEVNKFGGYTAASPTATITTSNLLGMQHVNIATCQRTNNITSCVTASPHGLPIGCIAPPTLNVNRCPAVLQNLTNMTDLSFAGEKAITSVSDSTHYSYIDNVDTRTGASSGVATGGVLYWGQAVHYVLPAHSGDGMWYVACSDRVTPGVFKAVGVSWPKNFNGGVPDGVLEINDWGVTMNGSNPTMPIWSIPTTCPTVASPDMLTTKLTAAVGNTLTTVTSAGNGGCAGGGCQIVIDTAPILATVTKAYPTYFAAVGNNSNNYYIFNSTVDFSTSNAGPSLVGGWVQINAPFLLGNSTWVGGDFFSNRDAPSFGFGSYPTVTCLAKPCIWLASSSGQQSELGRLEINMAGGGGNIAILVDGGGGGAGAYLHDLQTSVGADFTGFALLTRAGAPIHGSRMNFFAQNTPTDGDTFTPLVVFSGGEIRIDQMNTSGRGIFTRGDVSLGFDHIQGGIEPIVTATGNTAGGNKGMVLQLGWNGGIELDTIAHAVVAYLPGLGSAGVNVQYTGASPGPVPSSGVPFYTGQPVNNNGGTCQDPTYGSSTGNPYACTNAKFSSHIELLNTFSFFTDTLPNTLTCSVSPGGNVIISSQLQYRVVPVWSNGAEGRISNFSPPCPTSSGNQTVTVNWTPLPVAPAFWNIYQQFAPGNGSVRIRNDGGTFATACNSGQIPGTATSIVLVSSTNCATPPSSSPAGGPVWIKDFSINAFNYFMSNVLIATEIQPPANPPAGQQYWFPNANTHQFACLNSSGASCISSGGAVAPPSLSIQFNNSGVPGGAPVPTAPNGVAQVFTSTPAGGVGTAAGFHLPGVIPRTTVCPSNLDTILAADRAGLVEWNDASPCAVTLPQAGSGGGTNNDFTNNFVMLACDIGAGTATVTPTTSTITYLSGGIVHSAQPSMPVTTSQCAFTYSDNTNYFAVIISAAGVTSFTGDSVVYSNSGSTGPVTLTLNTQLANRVFANCTGGTAAPTFCAITLAMLPGSGSTTVNGQTCTLGSTCTLPPGTIIIPNAGVTGTTVNTLTKIIGATATAVIAATTDTSGVVGITTSGAGTAGSATIQLLGSVSCVFDGPTISGDYVQISSTTVGNCHDTGSAAYPLPGTGMVIGRALNTNGAGGTFTMDLFPAEINVNKNSVALGAGAGTAGLLACVTASNTMGNCTATPPVTFLGVFLSGGITYATSGIATVTIDATQNVTFGDILCASTIAGKTHDNGSVGCANGQWVGQVTTTQASTNSVTANLRLQ